MANARALDKRRKSVRNIRKITRTMELIATACFKKAMDRAMAATAYTDRITQMVSDLAQSGLELNHPLLETRETTDNATLLVLTANRGLCGGYNGNMFRSALPRRKELTEQFENLQMEVSGRRGIAGLRYRGIEIDETYTQFNDQPKYEEVEPIANRFLDMFRLGQIDRLDVVYTRFVSVSRQQAVVETLLPLGSISENDGQQAQQGSQTQSSFEFIPSAESILEEVVPESFRVRLFKCFLDAAVSEQVSRMISML